MAQKAALARQAREEERQRLIDKIKEWNDHRWDLFELSTPNEEFEFHGVMRFYFQDPQDAQQTTTKCVRVSSTASVRDVITILIEKFRPDMRLLGSSNYALYEVHGNGDERKLADSELPLLIQLNWHEDARDGRFLLKNEDDQTRPLTSITDEQPVGGFKRKLSKREKKEKKKKEKEAKLKGKENETPNKGSVAEKLYNELPETSFTRSISNPEAVMRRRRQQKLEKKLQQFKSRDGEPDSGGTLKIYGEMLRPDVPYKTLLLSIADPAIYVLKETLDKYGMEKEDPNHFVLVQRVMGGESDYILDDEDCPLAILMNHPPSKGTIMFHIRRRTADMPKKRKRKPGKAEGEGQYDPFSGQMNLNALPFLVELNPDGSEPHKAKRLLLPLNVTEVGSQRSLAVSGQYLQLYAPDIYPRHCVIAHTDGIVTVTPTSKDADTYVDNERIYDTTLLQHGMPVRFGKTCLFRFIEPHFEEMHGQERLAAHGGPVHGGPPPYNHNGPPPYDHNDPRAVETTFDVDGHIETSADPEQFQKMGYRGPPPGHDQAPQAILPAILEFREEGEQPFLMSIISEVNGAAVQFKLAPTYSLYMAARYRLSRLYRPDMPPAERADRLAAFLNRVASMIQYTIQENQKNAGALSFWMANASELLHFLKQDSGLSRPGLDSQDMLAEAVQVAFRYLVHCMQLELRNTMVAFLDDADHDLDDDEEYGQNPGNRVGLLSDVLQVLSSAMSLLRRCRVNAALTIQLFSQLFHYINMWLFNKLVLEPRLGLCTRLWGHRLKQRLGRVEIWAEKQGLELAADCHLARIIQAAHLLQSPKSSADDIASISSTCFKLNSLQLHALLSNYIPAQNEPRIPHELIDSVVAVAKNTADELTRSDGRDVRLEEEPDLQLPFLLPEDGYSCDIVRGVPNGLSEFLEPLSQSGILRLSSQPQASGLWTVHMTGPEDPENLRGMQAPPGGSGDHHGAPPKEPETVVVVFDKVNGSMGLSIVAAKGEGQEKRGIYIKSVVPGGAAALDGRLRPGDQLLDVDGMNLIGLTQEKAAELMTRTGHTVTLTVGKQGAIYHGLGALLNTPSPTLPRGSPRRSQGAGGKGLNRPKSEDVSRFNEPHEGGPIYGGPAPSPGGQYDMQRPLQQQMYAQSSPALNGEIDESSGPALGLLVAQAEARDRQAFWQEFVVSGSLNANLLTAKSSCLLSAWRRSRSQEQLRDPNDPYGQYQPAGVPQSQSYHNDLNRHAPPHNQYPDPAMRSKSTSNLDRPDQPYGSGDYRHAMSMSTLPAGRGGPGGGQPSRVMDRPGSHPELYKPDLRWVGPDVDRDYENYPGPQQQQPQPQQQQQPPPQQGMPDRYGGPPGGGDPRYMGQMQAQQPQPNYINHQQIQEQYQYSMDPRGSHSLSDLHSEHGTLPGQRPDPHQAMRAKSQEPDHSRVTEWQKQNEMEPWDQRPAPAGYNGGPHQGMPPQHGMYNQHPAEQGRPQMQEEPPRGLQGQFPPGAYPSSSSLRGREPTPPFGDRHPPQEAKPATPTKPGMKHPQEMVRTDSRQSNMYDPRGNPQQPQGQQPPPHQGPPPGNFPPSSQYPGYSQAGSMQPHQMTYQSSMTDTRTVHSQAIRDKPSPAPRADHHHHQQQQQYRRNETPDLPPPPPSMPPPNEPQHPHDWHPTGEELPPPPVSGADLEQQIREEEEKMMRRMAGLDPYGRDQRMGQDPQRFVSTQQQPEPQRPSPPGSNQPNYNQQLNNRPSMGQPQQQPQRQPQYPYLPKKENKPTASRPTKDNNNSNIHTSNTSLAQNQKRPPVAAKPKVMPKPNANSASPSPWERDEKERMNRMKEEEITRLRDNEIAELEEKPYRAPEEQDRLRRLRLDQEFERRVKEAKEDDEDGDSDNDITDRPAGRAVLFRQMQEDLEKKRQQIVEGRVQRDRDQEQAERDKLERQERRLQQFEQERDEQKQRQMKRQEKQERDAELYLAKQRDLRERQRREQEEQQRNMRMEEERRVEKQREEIRRKREMEKEQLRDMALVREAEERAMREEEMRQKDLSRNDRYSYEPAYRAQPAPPSQSVPPPQPNYPPPAPPERHSSYEIANLRNSTSMERYDPGAGPGPQPQTPRSASNSALRQAEAPSSGKKSVSFNSNLAVEINEKQMQYGSTSSEASLYSPQPVGQNNTTYVFHQGSTSSSTSEPPPTPFQRPNYGPGPTQGPNDVFEQRTPTNQGPPPTLVPGPTPGVVGAQEIYRDPRDRIAAKKAAGQPSRANPGPERMSFRDKMSMFAKEAGEQHTPKDRQKTSRAQRVIETDLNGQSVA